MGRVLLVAAVCFLAFTFYTSNRLPPALPDGSKPVPTETRTVAYTTDEVPDATFDVLDSHGNSLHSYYIDDDGFVYDAETGKPAGDGSGIDSATTGKLSSNVSIRLTHTRAAVNVGLDLGTFAGAFSSPSDSTDRFQVGVRYSPVRLAFDYLAPDVVITKDALGAGVSVYPTPEYFGRRWRHIGIGCWYMAPTDGGSPGWVFGASFSTRH